MTNDFTQHNEQQKQPYDINWNRPSFKPNIGFYLEKLIYIVSKANKFQQLIIFILELIAFCISPLTPSPILLLSLINLTLLLLLSSSSLLPSSFN